MTFSLFIFLYDFRIMPTTFYFHLITIYFKLNTDPSRMRAGWGVQRSSRFFLLPSTRAISCMQLESTNTNRMLISLRGYNVSFTLNFIFYFLPSYFYFSQYDPIDRYATWTTCCLIKWDRKEPKRIVMKAEWRDRETREGQKWRSGRKGWERKRERGVKSEHETSSKAMGRQKSVALKAPPSSW